MPFAPLFMKESVLTIDGTDFAAELSSIAFTPSSSVQTWKGLKPSSVFTETTSPTWTADLTFAQDFDSEDSLSVYLFENAGDHVAATFRPKAGGRTISATLILTPGAIGGAVDSHAAATVSLGVEGQPALGALV